MGLAWFLSTPQEVELFDKAAFTIPSDDEYRVMFSIYDL